MIYLNMYLFLVTFFEVLMEPLVGEAFLDENSSLQMGYECL